MLENDWSLISCECRYCPCESKQDCRDLKSKAHRNFLYACCDCHKEG